MSFDTLIVAREGWRLDVTLNRPESRNAMNAAMVRELARLFGAVEPSVRAVVLRGAGGSFCAGGDLKGMEGGSIRDVNRGFGAMLEQAAALPQLLVAVVEGPAMGGGLGLACVADVTIAAPDARFAMPEVRLGLIPAQIAPFVVRRIGEAAARRLALTGASLGAEEALRLGLASLVGEADGLLQEVMSDFAKCAPQAVAATKRLIARTGEVALPALLDEAADEFAEALAGDEARAGIAAFLTRAAPPWGEA